MKLVWIHAIPTFCTCACELISHINHIPWMYAPSPMHMLISPHDLSPCPPPSHAMSSPWLHVWHLPRFWQHIHIFPGILQQCHITSYKSDVTLDPKISHQCGIWANQPIHSFLVGCLNTCLQGTNV